MSEEKKQRLLIEQFISTLPKHIIDVHLKSNPNFKGYNVQTFNQLVSNFFASFADEEEEEKENEDEEDEEDEEEENEEDEEEEEDEDEDEDDEEDD